jgi:CheY-specific phosphatase CheX
MKPETRARLARITIPVAVVIGVFGAIDGKWPVVVAMALAVALQIMSYRSDRGNRG